jgi:hypothetical protein
MAGFETIVRPMVFPNIRPAPTRSLPPADDPNQGKCIIGGGGGGIISTSESGSASGSLHGGKEVERRVDVARIYQKNKDGTINKDNFIDVEVPNRIKMDSPIDPGTGSEFGGAGGGAGNPDALKGSGGGGKARNVYDYAPVQEKDNIEVMQKNVIRPIDAGTGSEFGGAGGGAGGGTSRSRRKP